MKPNPEVPSSINDDDHKAKRSVDHRMSAHIEIARALAESHSLKDVSTTVLRQVSEALGFELGILWRVDAEVMVCDEVWHSTAIDAKNFVEKTRKTEIRPGIGLPGRVWVSKQPVWVEITSEVFRTFCGRGPRDRRVLRTPSLDRTQRAV